MNVEQNPSPALPCAVVRDLLPLYLEGLTSPQTDQAVETHLELCPNCAQYKAALTAPLSSPEPTADQREPDYLKTIRRRGLRRTVLTAFGVVLAMLLLFCAKLFYIGSPAQAEELLWRTEQQKEDCLTLFVSTSSSGAAFRGWQVERQGDTAVISLRKTLASSLFGGSGQAAMDIPLKDLRQIELCGALVWQEGESIPRETWLAWQAATPYTGDAAALGKLAQALNVGALCGDFTSSLQTDEAPYAWTLHFSQVPQDAPLLDRQMERLAYQMLALVDNLEQVRWTYPQYGGHQVSRTLTLQQADYRLSVYNSRQERLKSYSQSPADLERLRQTVAAEDFPINP